MPTDEFGDRTEQATPRRRQESREKGNVARSVDLNAAGHMLAAAIAMFLLGHLLIRSIADLLTHYLGRPAWLELDQQLVLGEFARIVNWSTLGVLPVLLLLVAAAVFVNVAQVGFLVAPESIQPKLSRLNPIQGLQRIFSLPSLVRLAVSLGKLVVLAVLAAWFIMAALPGFLNLINAEPAVIGLQIGRAVVNLSFLLAVALIVLGLADYGFQKWKFERDLRMTKQEVREELKNMEGDPLIRQRRRDSHRKLTQARELQAVREADVVVTNPTHIAVALKYDPDKMPAPTVIAKGMGEIAQRIRQIAIENGVPIIERKELARSMYRTIPVGHIIPVELYGVFVEIMAYVYRITGRTPSGLD